MSKKYKITNPVEKPIAEILESHCLEYEHDNVKSSNLDFYIPSFDIYIECKAFYSDRIIRQIKDKGNVIVVQGEESAKFLKTLLQKSKSIEIGED